MSKALDARLVNTFCRRCHSLLTGGHRKEQSGPLTVCGNCEYENTLVGVEGDKIFMGEEILHFTPFVEVTREQLEAEAKETTKAMVNKMCQECGNPEMLYFALQLRSADEGATVFYECPKCGFTDNVQS